METSGLETNSAYCCSLSVVSLSGDEENWREYCCCCRPPSSSSKVLESKVVVVVVVVGAAGVVVAAVLEAAWGKESDGEGKEELNKKL